MDFDKLENDYWDFRSYLSENKSEENFTITESGNSANVFYVFADIYNVKWN